MLDLFKFTSIFMKRKWKVFHSWILIDKSYNAYFEYYGGFANIKFLNHIDEVVIHFKNFQIFGLVVGKP